MASYKEAKGHLRRNSCRGNFAPSRPVPNSFPHGESVDARKPVVARLPNGSLVCRRTNEPTTTKIYMAIGTTPNFRSRAFRQPEMHRPSHLPACLCCFPASNAALFLQAPLEVR